MHDPLDSYSDLIREQLDEAIRVVGLDAETDGSLSQYREQPLRFARRVLNHHHWAAGRCILENLWKHKRVTVRACHKSSKTYTAADAVLAFVSTAPSIVVTSAPTGFQMRELLWAKIRTGHASARLRLPGECLTTSLRIGPEWYAVGFSTKDPGHAMGFHSGVDAPTDDTDPEEQVESALRLSHDTKRRLLFVTDEAPEVDQFYFDAIKGSLAGENVYSLMQGNPILPSDAPHDYARSHHPGSGWFRIRISAIPDPEDELGSEAYFPGVPEWLMPAQWVADRRKEWTGDHPFWLSRVLGRFADAADDAGWRVCPESVLIQAVARAGTSPQGAHVGVDIARSFDGDESVAALWIDGVKRDESAWRSKDLMDTATRIRAQVETWAKGLSVSIQADSVHVDVVGLGGGVVDRLRQMGFHVDAVDFGSSPLGDWRHLTGETAFGCRRDEIHWAFRRVLEEGLGHLPQSFAESWREATWARYEPKSGGSKGSIIKVEPKEKIRARHGRSPDRHDADLLAWSRGGSMIPRVLSMPRRRW
jgi:hypothetical protein